MFATDDMGLLHKKSIDLLDEKLNPLIESRKSMINSKDVLYDSVFPDKYKSKIQNNNIKLRREHIWIILNICLL